MPTLDDNAGQQLAITMNPAHADKLLAGSGHTFAELLALVDGGQTAAAASRCPRASTRR